MAFVYILYSRKRDIFYIGATATSPKERLEKHIEKYYPGNFTTTVNDWELFYGLECENMRQALLIEKHIKKMKSRKYLNNINKFPEISLKLKQLYKGL
jgi:putative endonuclease